MTMVPRGSSIPATGPVTLLIATRKGAWFLKGDSGRRSWAIEGPVFLGQMMHHLVRDPRDQGTLLMATRTGHLCRTIYHPRWSRGAWLRQYSVGMSPQICLAPASKSSRDSTVMIERVTEVGLQAFLQHTWRLDHEHGGNGHVPSTLWHGLCPSLQIMANMRPHTHELVE
jgi:hypothetical protein